MKTKDELQAIVYSNLDNAVENGYHDIATWPYDEIITDLQTCASDCEDLSEAEMMPHVLSWVALQLEQKA